MINTVANIYPIMNFTSKLPRLRLAKEEEIFIEEPNAIEKFFSGVFPEAADDEWSECESDYSDSAEVREPISQRLGLNHLATSFRSKLQRHRDAYEVSPAKLAKLMTKFDKKEEQVEFLNQQLCKSEEEAMNIKQSIKDLSAKCRIVLSGDGDEEPSISNLLIGSPASLDKLVKKLENKKKQTEFLKEELHKTEEEVVETKKSIKAISVRYREVL